MQWYLNLLDTCWVRNRGRHPSNKLWEPNMAAWFSASQWWGMIRILSLQIKIMHSSSPLLNSKLCATFFPVKNWFWVGFTGIIHGNPFLLWLRFNVSRLKISKLQEKFTAISILTAWCSMQHVAVLASMYCTVAGCQYELLSSVHEHSTDLLWIVLTVSQQITLNFLLGSIKYLCLSLSL